MQLNVIIVSCKLLISPEAEHIAFEESPKVAAQQYCPLCPSTPITETQTQGTIEGREKEKNNFSNYESLNEERNRKKKKFEFMLAQRLEVWPCLIKPWKHLSWYVDSLSQSGPKGVCVVIQPPLLAGYCYELTMRVQQATLHFVTIAKFHNLMEKLEVDILLQGFLVYWPVRNHIFRTLLIIGKRLEA